MKFLIVKVVQNQAHILSSWASFKTAERVWRQHQRKNPDQVFEVRPFVTARFSPAQLEARIQENKRADRERSLRIQAGLLVQENRLLEQEIKSLSKNY
jgi:acyl-CoA thioesterase